MSNLAEAPPAYLTTALITATVRAQCSLKVTSTMKIQHCRKVGWCLCGVGLGWSVMASRAAGDLNTHGSFRARYGKKNSMIKVITRFQASYFFSLFTITLISPVAHAHNSVQCVTFHQSVTHFVFASTAACYIVYQIQYILFRVSHVNYFVYSDSPSQDLFLVESPCCYKQ